MQVLAAHSERYRRYPGPKKALADRCYRRVLTPPLKERIFWEAVKGNHPSQNWVNLPNNPYSQGVKVFNQGQTLLKIKPETSKIDVSL
jgi:hypothetical protein